MQVFLYNRAALYSTLSLMRLTVDQTNVQPTTDQPTSETTDQRVTVPDAALLLGLSEDAVRSRLRRGTLRRETGRDGTVFVVLGTDRPASYQRPTDNRSTNQQNDRQTAGQSIDSHVDSRGGSETYRDELVEALRDELAYLRDQLDRERDASAELRRIVAGLVQRVPELEAAPEPRNAPKTASEGMVNSDDVPSEPERVSWLRRLLRA